ncbi:multidrug effflux MFS transporter [Ruania alba]|uniref:MFS transporter, DHA1 family, bicyclomycin/chloramphenicol resistance protein n=1 Tax=Ruania alba TaxID=648782 RepID=A0A1H5M6T2_9MICO|nr:multidrug effflux MFS transporter [Ruania alba]SEE84467.1 MFS transporter, DHA1 family, bicyclomycin/chloramphenicol resistance protein [Ruania alba]
MSFPAPTRERLGFGFVLLLSALVAIGPLTIDLYLAAFPQIVTDLDTSPAKVQLTMTATLAGLAVGQLVIGSLSDSYGRRRPLLIALAVYVLSSLAIIGVQNVEALTLLRVVQGLTGGAGMVLALAVVRDRFGGMGIGTVISRLMLVVGVAPILAPTLGAQILRFGSWRMMFGVLAVFGVLMLVVAWVFLKESLPRERRRSSGIGAALASYRSLLTDWSFIGAVLMGAFAMGAMFTYVSSSTFVFQEGFGLTESQFGYIFGAGALAVTAGSQINGALVRRMRPERIVTAAITVGWLLTLALFVVTLVVAEGEGFWLLLALLVPTLGTVGFVMPSVPAIVLEHNGHRAGSAAALNGAMGFVLGALVSPVSGLLGGTAQAMAGVMVGVMTISALLLVAVRRQWRHPVPPAIPASYAAASARDLA